MKTKFYFILIISAVMLAATFSAKFYSTSDSPRTTKLFTKEWHFKFGDVKDGQNPSLDDSNWRLLDLPHDWSIEGIAISESKKADVPEFQVVKGEWKFSEGDNMLWKNPDLNDNSWQTVELPSNWETSSNYTQDNVYGWYRP